jgi:hypothetical protein
VTAAPWREKLAAATTESEVVEVATAYLQTLDRMHVAMLPLRCRPRALRCAYDVSSYAFELVGHYSDKSDDAGARLVQSLATFFTDASIRLSEIIAETNAREAILPSRAI